MASSTVTTRVLDGFDDPAFGPEPWERLLQSAGLDVVYLTWHYQRSWWEAFGRGQLLLVVAERDGRVVALAPFYARSGMVYFVGAAYWEADRLDFVGDIGDPDVLDALLETARNSVPDFLGFQMEFVPERSGTGERLQAAADRLGLSCLAEWDYCASALDLVADTQGGRATANKRGLRKLERFFQRGAPLTVRHLRDGEEILRHLDEFFEQHIARWAAKAIPSPFLKPQYRDFYERLTRSAARSGWLRFTRLDWQGRPIAFHYGFCYHGRYYWNAASFDVDLAEHSPGQVLIRQLLLAAVHEGATTFDFGTGDQSFKLRFGPQVTRVRGWGLYPGSACASRPDAALVCVPEGRHDAVGTACAIGAAAKRGVL